MASISFTGAFSLSTADGTARFAIEHAAGLFVEASSRGMFPPSQEGGANLGGPERSSAAKRPAAHLH